ncbi:hypothetical protein TNCV_3391451 [Trichonephila clavipes]|nr:hypothetical protein TNCV_3391451 [Trichonephila clavipes]
MTRIQTCIATHGRKIFVRRLVALFTRVLEETEMHYRSHFELSSPAQVYRTFYEHRASRYAPDLGIGRRKCTSSRKIVSQKVRTERFTGPQDV